MIGSSKERLVSSLVSGLGGREREKREIDEKETGKIININIPDQLH